MAKAPNSLKEKQPLYEAFIDGSRTKSARRILPSQSQLDLAQIQEAVFELRTQYKYILQGAFELGSDTFRVRRLYRPGGTLIDLGGGISAHNGVLAQLGMTVYVVDLLDEYWQHKSAAPTEIAREVELLESCGVRFISHEISTYDVTKSFADRSVDVITSFHCIEHLHNSPRPVLESAMRVLKPGGTMLLEVPNAANIRKRLALLCGKTNYGSYDDFYHSEHFVGHVREYTVGDLHLLASNLRAPNYRIFGQNNTVFGKWVTTFPRRTRKVLDRALQIFPSLCSSILLEITKPESA